MRGKPLVGKVVHLCRVFHLEARECSLFSMKLLFWNIRGLGRPSKRRKIRTLLKERNIDMVFLQKTKKSELTLEVVRSIWPVEDMDYMSVNAAGLARGILCIWKPSVFSLSECCCSRSFILLSGTILPVFSCVLINIYAPNDVDRRNHVWKVLSNLKPEFSVPWCIRGDFNEIRSIRERKGCIRVDRGIRTFNEFIEELELFDLPMQGRQFTWSNSSDRGKWSRIDRILLSVEWLERFKFCL